MWTILGTDGTKQIGLTKKEARKMIRRLRRTNGFTEYRMFC